MDRPIIMERTDNTQTSSTGGESESQVGEREGEPGRGGRRRARWGCSSGAEVSGRGWV